MNILEQSRTLVHCIQTFFSKSLRASLGCAANLRFRFSREHPFALFCTIGRRISIGDVAWPPDVLLVRTRASTGHIRIDMDMAHGQPRLCAYPKRKRETPFMPSKPKVFVTRIIPEAGLSLIRAACDAEIWPDPLPPSADVLLARIADLDGLVSL